MIQLIVGLPGSGKTRYAESLVGEGWVLFDDPGAGDLPAILEALKGGQKVLLTDPFLCLSQHRETAKRYFKDYTIEWVFFANDPQQCLRNASHRDRHVVPTIERFTKVYVIPDGAVVRPVWQD